MSKFPELPPGKYFISHSYKDATVRDAFMKTLSPQATPYVFPPISVSPLEFVSSTLIGAVLACDALIYLNEGFSSRSFWVAFERDYALRIGKPVFAYTPSTNTFVEHTESPLDLIVFPLFSHKDRTVAEAVMEFMIRYRYFSVFGDERLLASDDWWHKTLNDVASALSRGGYLLRFIADSEVSQKQESVLHQLENGRTVLGFLGSTTSDYLRQYQHLIVNLYEENQLNNNRLDDLIVRLYWLMFQVQYPQYCGENARH